ncbi:hypothetical protein LMTR13_16400 [Bradyrhizobium icense]|uniref:Uncharacterized protein n=1 Tax=Bradyrhizobium icense TaxID=1274631 RepID=A0A1B1UFH2_9BRAD|nr:hypothetical protein LMTR13_16400 [Bradyrhizobium icense]
MPAKGQNLGVPCATVPRIEKAAYRGRLECARFGWPYWQMCLRPSSPRNQVSGVQTKPLRRAYSSPPIGALAAAIGAVAMVAAVPTVPPTTPAATSPGQKPLS